MSLRDQFSDEELKNHVQKWMDDYGIESLNDVGCSSNNVQDLDDEELESLLEDIQEDMGREANDRLLYQESIEEEWDGWDD